MEEDSNDVPHLQFDINIDGVQIFDNSEAPGIIPILGTLQSVRPRAISEEGMVRFRRPKPFIIGFYRGL